jgi:hypothetical protein
MTEGIALGAARRGIGASSSRTPPRSLTMLKTMTSNFIQLSLAGLTAVALTFPTPESAVEAVTSLWDKPIEIVEVREEAVVVPTSIQGEALELAYDPVADCLLENEKAPTERLNYCARILYARIAMTPDRPGLDYDQEQRRAALQQLCRGLWLAHDGDTGAIQNPHCSFAVLGVENPA